MRVLIENQWFFPALDDKMVKNNAENPLFYVVLLQKGRQRYLKIGTTERTIKQRFRSKDYKQYSFIKFLYVAEVTTDTKKHVSDACYHVEDLTRSAIREMKGFTFVKNDRFQFFQLPDLLPVYLGFDEKIFIPVR